MSYNEQDDILATESARKTAKKKTVLLGKGPPFFWAKPWGSSHENIRSYPWNIGC
jgi:hypothetical protein